MPAARPAPAVALVVDASSGADGSWTQEIGRQVETHRWSATWIVSGSDQVSLLPGCAVAGHSVGLRYQPGAVSELCVAIDRLRAAGEQVDTLLSPEPVASSLAARLAALGVRVVISESAAAADLRPVGSGIWQAGIGVSVPAARGLAALLKKSPRQRLGTHRSGLIVARLDLRSSNRTARTQKETRRILDWLAAAPRDRFAFPSLADVVAARDAQSIGRPQRSILRAA